MNYSFDEIKTFVLDYHKIAGTNADKQRTMTEMLTQLGFEVHNCNCTSQTSKLYGKLSEWLKRHPNGFSSYKLNTDRLLFDGEGKAITKLNFDDEKAEYLLNSEETAKYVEKVEAETNTGDKTTEDTTTEDKTLEEQIEAVKASTTGKRTVSKSAGKRKITSKK